MSEKISVTISDSTAANIRENVTDRKRALSEQKAMLRHGARRSRELEELTDEPDVSTEEAVEFAVQFMATDD